MNRLKPLITTFVVLFMLAGAFAYGKHISHMEMTNELRQAHLVASGYLSQHNPIDYSASADAQDTVIPTTNATYNSNQKNVRIAQNPGSSGSGSSDNIDDLLSSDSPMATFQQVYLLLKDQYVEKIPSDTPLSHGAAAAMLDSLDDPNSRFLEPAERTAMEQQAKGVYAGTGLVFTVRRVEHNNLVDRQVTVIDALPGSPADKAGLRTGDVITTVNGHWIIGYDPFAAQYKLLNKLKNDEYDWNKVIDSIDKKILEGISLSKAQSQLDTTQTAPVALIVQRPGVAKPIQVSLDCSSPTTVKDVSWRKLDNGKGYIQVNAFSGDTATNFAQAVSALGDTKGIVLDLRNCPGGLLDPAVSIAHSLQPSASFGMVTIRDNHAPKTAASAGAAKTAFGTRTEVLKEAATEQSTPITYQGNIAVLVNKGTANTAELLAAFLHDHDGAKIVGASTFGDAMAQTLFPLTDGSGFTLTTGMLKTDIGKSFDISGLTPDIAMKDTGEAGQANDPGLQRAMAVLDQAPLATAQARS